MTFKTESFIVNIENAIAEKLLSITTKEKLEEKFSKLHSLFSCNVSDEEITYDFFLEEFCIMFVIEFYKKENVCVYNIKHLLKESFTTPTVQYKKSKNSNISESLVMFINKRLTETNVRLDKDETAFVRNFIIETDECSDIKSISESCFIF